MTTKGQMKPPFRVSLTMSQARVNSQNNVPEQTIVSSILTNLLKMQRKKRSMSEPIVEPVTSSSAALKAPSSASKLVQSTA